MADDANVEVQRNKPHKKRLSGRKAAKKLKKTQEKGDNAAKESNSKAFTFQHPVRAEKRFRRVMNIKVKKTHVPNVDREPLRPAPHVVAVVGPPKVGKSTLIRCLVRHYTKQKLSEIKGPITVVSGKKKRLTFFECNNDINSMIDIGKVADLVLLLIDAKFGFEMETFEFMNICQVHGFPRIIGILTHLDLFKKQTQARRRKKILKTRFWTEIYKGAKLFYLSGIENEEYKHYDIHNLCRFISVTKFRQLQWRRTHPYVLADRLEDITDPELIKANQKCDRTVCFYGFARGANFKQQNVIHIPGCGDLVARDIMYLPDPCPLPEKEKKRSLTYKETMVFAPMCGVGGVFYDKDAVYIVDNEKDTEEVVEEQGPLKELIDSLKESQLALDDKIASSSLQIFRHATPIISQNVTGNANILEETVVDFDTGRRRRKVMFSDEVENGMDKDEEVISDGDSGNEDDGDYDLNDGNDHCDDKDDEDELLKRKQLSTAIKQQIKSSNFGQSENVIGKNSWDGVVFDDDESGDDDEYEESNIKWKDDLARKAADAFYKRQNDTPNLRNLVYSIRVPVEKNDDAVEDDEEIGGLFKVSREKGRESRVKQQMADEIDCSKFVVSRVMDWDLEEVRDKIKDCFVTGKWKFGEDAQDRLNLDDELYGDFEDLETGKVHKGKSNDEPTDKSEGNKEEEQVETLQTEMSLKERRMAKKRKLKEQFNKLYDSEADSAFYNDLKSEVEEQSKLNKTEFNDMDDATRVKYEGFRAGMYVRIEVGNVPYELIRNFNPDCPLIIGGLLSGEENIGVVQVRMKKHRWYNRILKSRDPLIISLGWRRFQTMPLYSIKDQNLRNRLLKYTPEHLHCLGSFYGPLTPQGTGMLAVQSVVDISTNFRIAVTGVVTELDKSFHIVKKLKLTGYPLKIFQKTVLVKGMFNSALEVSKFEGAALKTVSGLNGQLKHSIPRPEGAFRAVFQDKILMSDVVFLRAWYTVHVPRYYNPVTSLLVSSTEKWVGMKTVGQLRFERNLKPPVNKSSFYTAVKRREYHEKPLVVPKKLLKELPYLSKLEYRGTKQAYDITSERMTIIPEPREQKISALMKMLKDDYAEKRNKAFEAKKVRLDNHKKMMDKTEKKLSDKQKETRKARFRLMSKIEKNKKNKVGFRKN